MSVACLKFRPARECPVESCTSQDCTPAQEGLICKAVRLTGLAGWMCRVQIASTRLHHYCLTITMSIGG